MIERLITSLDVLAAPVDVQLRRIAGDVGAVTSDEQQAAAARDVALEFADALLLVSDCPQVRLTGAQREVLDKLDAQLETMLRDGGVDVWRPAGLRGRVEWEITRRLATEARLMLRAGT